MGAPRPALAAFVALAVASGGAAAQPVDKPVAEALFQEGRALLQAGKIDEACAKFAGSERIDPKIGTLLNLADCHERQGKTATAWAEWNQVSTRAQRASQTERQRIADERIRALEPRLSRVALTPDRTESGLVVRIDDLVLDSAVFGTPIPLDPGEHALSVSAPGRKSWSIGLRVEAAPGVASVHIPPLEGFDVSPPARATPPREERTLPKPRVIEPAPFGPLSPLPPPAETHTGRKTAGWVSIGAGALAVGAGAYFGLRAIGLRNDARGECDPAGCSQRGLDLTSDAKLSANVSTAAIGVGIVVVAVGVYLLLASPQASHRTQSRAVASPRENAPTPSPRVLRRRIEISGSNTTNVYADREKLWRPAAPGPRMNECLALLPPDAKPEELGSPTWSGGFVLRLTSTGRITDVTVVGPTRFPVVDGCVATALRAIALGPTDTGEGGEVTLSYVSW